MKQPGPLGRAAGGLLSVLTALLLTYAGTASAQTVPVAGTGIAATKHNLGSNAAAGNNRVSDTAEICVFCHTPHGADTAAPAPLWNKRLGAAGTPAGGGGYQTYDTLQTPSLDGQVAAVGSISMACLSCHDGTQAMDNIINAPGSGQVLADGGNNNGRAWSWTSNGSLSADGFGMLASGPAAIGTDLRNDHPISIQYCGGGLSGTGTSVSGTCVDSDFKAPSTAVINTNQIFWVDTGGTGKQRTDLPLYTRTTGGLGPMVECASCHDPHVSTAQAGPTGTGQVAGETFLRISNASSAVCTACHVK